MKKRSLAQIIIKAIKTFPAIVVTGPRQSGKTTLLKTLFPKTHQFVSLEDPNVRMRVREDPVAFLEHYDSPLILDEIQYVPELLSYIKTKIDEDRRPGRWLFTGSQNFTLMQGVSQSLAGRVAVLTLLPFSYSERAGHGDQTMEPARWLNEIKKTGGVKDKNSPSVSEFLLRGNYPEIASIKSVDRQLWCSSYVATYLERDVRNLAQIGDLAQFERFLKMCAVRTGQILNLSEMARDIGVSVPTAKRWLSILETSYLIHLLYPYYKNLDKRLIKSPKLYFCDTALASYLLGLHDAETLLKSSDFGRLFETMIVNDVFKRFLHSGQMPSMYYMKTRDGLEIDLVLEIGQKLHLFEVKSASTITSRHASSLRIMLNEFQDSIGTAAILSNSRENFLVTRQINNYNWKNVLNL